MKRRHYTTISERIMTDLETWFENNQDCKESDLVSYIYMILSDYANVNYFNKAYALAKAMKKGNRKLVAEIILDFMEWTEKNMFEEVKKNKIIETIYCNTRTNTSDLLKKAIRLINWYDLKVDTKKTESIHSYGKHEIDNCIIHIFKNKKITIQAL